MCNKKLIGALINDCTVQPVMGLRSGVIVNRDDIRLDAVTTDGATVTGLSLRSGATGYPVKWLKRMGSNNNSLSYSATERDGFIHSFSCQLAGFSAENAERINELKNGNFVLIAESNFKGVDNKDAFKIFGLTAGMTLTEATHGSNEASGAITYTLSTEEGNFEEYLFQTLYLNDYESTAILYGNMFVTTLIGGVFDSTFDNTFN
ncbi:hypothetical protein Phi46:1_gp05 [Cellulophaga phage phi46:1]|uniref:hypothetical protein n=1 Tax=Cellulophaga phage phi46:1 TaxID=1327974 RepID=UPI000351F55F|nr:hypothetical protein Phi46:1_gp05 [Cellulophaga phage phi46:1]AGO47816.1 hypothetical protein Phi46:1_gp05 [Cellulophaga phage phi46:1]